jgi:hypothetical protein
MSSQTVPLDLSLINPDGSPARLGDHLEQPLTVVQLVRYFGCLPCQEWLVDLDGARDRLAEWGAAAIAVGGSADYQATYLQAERGVAMPLLLDPEQSFRNYVEGASRPMGWRLANPKGAAAYVGSLTKGFKPQKITRDTVRSPGVVILDRSGAVVWSYIGTRIGDYPPIEELLVRLESLQPLV